MRNYAVCINMVFITLVLHAINIQRTVRATPGTYRYIKRKSLQMLESDGLAFSLYNETQPEEEVSALFQIWLNERLSPTLLPYAEDIVANLLELIANQQVLLSEQLDAHLNTLYQMEVERLRYVIASYLRCRLAKIEAYWIYWLKDETLLSSEERIYLGRYAKCKAKALEGSVLKHLPAGLAELPTDELVAQPETDAHVICRVLEEVGTVRVHRDMNAELQKNDIYVLRFRLAEELLHLNKVALI
jgi:GINS complex subunit 4